MSPPPRMAIRKAAVLFSVLGTAEWIPHFGAVIRSEHEANYDKQNNYILIRKPTSHRQIDTCIWVYPPFQRMMSHQFNSFGFLQEV